MLAAPFDNLERGKQHAIPQDLGRLPSRHAVDAARPVRLRGAARAQRPHALCRGRSGRAAMGRQERRQFRPPLRRRPGRREASCRGRTSASTSWPSAASTKTRKKGKARCSDPHLRLKDMEADGVDAEVIYGVLGTASQAQRREASNEMLRIYNDWLRDFCSHYPDRQIGLACLPYGSVDDAVKEVHRVAKMGLKGLELSCSWDMEPMWHPSLGAVLERGRRRAIAVALPHLPDDPAARPPGGAAMSAARRCSPASRRSRWGSSTSSPG